MKYTCKFCGERFTPTKEEIEAHQNGYSDRPDICSECEEMQNVAGEVNDEPFSDADPGL